MSLKLILYSNIVVTVEDDKEDHPRGYYDIRLTYGASPEMLELPQIGTLRYTMGLVHLDFNKQMYQPGEINARIQISQSSIAKLNATSDDMSFFMFNQSTLNDYFLNCPVDLMDEKSNTIATGYFVYEIIPEYTDQSLYINFKIYSPDKLMTLGKYCHAYSARRLGKDILNNEAAYFKLPEKYDTSKTDDNKNARKSIATSLKLQNQLKHGADEYIQPYLVQYNESFYDFLIRTANRWGEFVYFEDGNLILGRSSNSHTISSFNSISYHNNKSGDPISVSLNQRNTTTPETFNGGTDHTKAMRKDTVSQDEYLANIALTDRMEHEGDIRDYNRRFKYSK